MKKLLTKKEPEKKLLLSFKKRAGRSRSGEVTVRHRGGGAKRLYRIIDFGQEKMGIPAKRRQFGGISGWRKGYKKAVVKLKKGQKIEIFPK